MKRGVLETALRARASQRGQAEAACADAQAALAVARDAAERETALLRGEVSAWREAFEAGFLPIGASSWPAATLAHQARAAEGVAAAGRLVAAMRDEARRAVLAEEALAAVRQRLRRIARSKMTHRDTDDRDDAARARANTASAATGLK